MYSTVSSSVTLKDLLDSSILKIGEELTFKGHSAFLLPSGNLSYQKREYTSLSNWAKEIAHNMGLSKHYNGWRVVTVRGRPVSQFRDFYQALKKGEPFSFPPLIKPRKRRRRFANVSKPRGNIQNGSYLPYGSPCSISGNPKVGVDPSSNFTNSDSSFPSLFLKNDSNPNTDNSSSETNNTSVSNVNLNQESGCGDLRCVVCKWGPPSYFSTEVPTWSDILQVVLYSLKVIRPENDYFSLRDDIYDYLDRHWNKLCVKPRSLTWRQTAKMTLAHSRYSNIFENGYNVYMRTGFWRLRTSINPYQTNESTSVPTKRKIQDQQPYQYSQEFSVSDEESEQDADVEPFRSTNWTRNYVQLRPVKRRKLSEENIGKIQKREPESIGEIENVTSDSEEGVRILVELSHKGIRSEKTEEIAVLKERHANLLSQLEIEKSSRLALSRSINQRLQELSQLQERCTKLSTELETLKTICDDWNDRANQMDDLCRSLRSEIDRFSEIRDNCSNISHLIS